MDLSSDFFTYMMIGFMAQLVDGSLGMAFGVISSTILLLSVKRLSSAQAYR